MTVLRSVEVTRLSNSPAHFPFSVPFARAGASIDLAPLTFLVGENGSGKSTFLEALACAIGSITVGADSVQTDPTLADVRAFAAKCIKLTWNKRSKKGFFLRAEDFFGYARRMADTKAEMEQGLRDVDSEYQNRSDYARSLAKLPYARSLHEMREDYGEGLDVNSHGEGFLKLFQARFTGEGVYLLDEPEAPLSPTRQLTLLSMMHAMLEKGAQFVIATHSPILLAYPGALILSFDSGAIQPAAYETLEHVVVTRAFLENPKAYLRHLLE
ncbi:MAG: AAA family ATPase [Chloroflexi bacterium]|nr:AAA family ATPase [Chloroflexota bacterium]